MNKYFLKSLPTRDYLLETRKKKSKKGEQIMENNATTSNDVTPAQPTHQHTWVSNYITVHHDAVYQNNPNVKGVIICNGCGDNIIVKLNLMHMQEALVRNNSWQDVVVIIQQWYQMARIRL